VVELKWILSGLKNTLHLRLKKASIAAVANYKQKML